MKTKIILLLILILLVNYHIVKSQSVPLPIPKPITGMEPPIYNKETKTNILIASVSNHFPSKMTRAGTITYHPTGVHTIYDLQSNGVPQQIWQDPLNPNNVHAVFMHSTVPGFAARFCAYLYSSNLGVTWSHLGNVPSNVRSGFPSIDGLSNGAALIANHNISVGPSAITMIYYDAGIGFGVFTELNPGPLLGIEGIWPKIVSTSNISNTRKFVFGASINNQGGDAATNTGISLTPPGTFSGYSSYEGDNAEGYFFARSSNGKIGHAYIGNGLNPSDSYDAFFRESSDDGLTWSTPIRIWNWNPNTDSLGLIRGINMTYANNTPIVTFATSPLSDGGFLPERPSQIRMWNPTVNNGIPVVAADSNTVPFFPNFGNVADAFLPLCRPCVGKSSSGDVLFIAFSATTGQYSNFDSSSFYSAWITSSSNGGAVWGNHEKITPNTPLRDWRYISISQSNNVSNNQLTVQMVCQSDSIAGSHVQGSPQGDAELIGIRLATSLIAAPSAPILLSPSNGAVNVSLTPLLDWNNVSNANTYRVQLARDINFTNILIDQSNLTLSQYLVSPSVLTYDSLYYWRVSATNANGTGAWSSVWSFRTTTFLPPAPVLISPPNNATEVSLIPTLDWNDVSGALSYRLQLATDTNFTNVIINQTNLTTSQYTISPSILSLNTIYYWRVNSTNSNGTGLWSSIWKFTTISLPTAPVLVSPSNGSTGISITPLLDWNNVSNATSYRVQLAADSNFVNNIINQPNITSSQYQVPSSLLSFNTKYYWRVNAENTAGTGPWSNIWNFTTSTLAVPAAPVLVSPSNGSFGISLTPILDWNNTSGATSYRIQLGLDLNFNFIILDQSNVNASQFTVPVPILTLNTLYFWRVNATNTAGTGPWSPIWNFRTTILTGLTTIGVSIPEEFNLYYNYPNPFNPTTNIRFDVSENSPVKLRIYDFRGREILTLINEELPAASYKAEFNAKDLSSGVYFYRLEAGKYANTKRMLLIK